jgi:GDP-fucose transporter C1
MKEESLFFTTAVIAFYFVTSLSLVFLNKYLFARPDIDAPIFMTWTQLVIAVLILVPYTRSLPFNLRLLLKTAPLSLLFLIMLISSNLCLKSVDISFYLVARAWTIIFNLLFAYVILGTRTSILIISTCLVIVIGYLLACEGQYGLSILLFELKAQVAAGAFSNSGVAGLFWGLSASASLSLYSIGAKKVSIYVNNNDQLLMLYLNVNVSLLLIPIMYIAGEYEVVMASPLLYERKFWILLLIAGISGVLINVATLLQIRYTSALTHNVSGTAKATVQSVFGWFTDNKVVNNSTVIGTLIVIFGCACYSFVRLYEDSREKKKIIAKNC